MKKFENVIFGICLAIIVFIVIAIRPLASLDEIWNFNIARGISNGLVPYKDLSMVSTPLLAFITAIPLKIFGQEMFYTRILTIFLTIICFILMNKILKNIDIKKEISNVVMLVVLLAIVNFISISYNLLALLFILQIILLEVKLINCEKWKKLKVHFFIGLIAGLIICSKQSIGLIVSIIVTLNPLFFIKKKEDIKRTLIACGLRAIGIIIPVSAFIIYLFANNTFEDFISYSVTGIKTFSNKISYRNLLESQYIWVKACSIIIPVVLTIELITNIALKCLKRENNVLYILTLYSLATFFIVFPISDIDHFLFAIIPCSILIVYSLKELLKKICKIDFKYILELANILSVLVILSFSIWLELSCGEILGQMSKYDYGRHFKYINISTDLSESIDEISEYIMLKEKKVYILDATAAVYMIPIDRYNKNYDMFCIGNLGSGGEDAIIEGIKNEDALYLIMRLEENLNWQNPTKVRAYIKENMEFVENKGIFEVYQNKPVEIQNTEGEIVEPKEGI